MVERKLDIALILEDDVRFEYDFRNNMTAMMKEAQQISPTVQWDLMYVFLFFFTIARFFIAVKRRERIITD